MFEYQSKIFDGQAHAIDIGYWNTYPICGIVRSMSNIDCRLAGSGWKNWTWRQIFSQFRRRCRNTTSWATSSSLGAAGVVPCARLGFSDLPSLTWGSLIGGSPIWWGPHAVRAGQGHVRDGKLENPRRHACFSCILRGGEMKSSSMQSSHTCMLR
jgi:hypothetical protein